MTKKKPKNNVSETLHSLATDMHMAGMLSDEQMSAFDVRFLAPIEPMKAKQIKKLRTQQLHISQSTLAACLNVKTNTVSKWEQGISEPDGAASRLLNIIKKHGLAVLSI